jgi:hypothetical protein
MTYQFDIADIPAVILAVTDANVTLAEIPARVQGMFDIVYDWLPTAVVQKVGLNYMVYDLFTRQGMRMRVGFAVAERFADGELVKCIELQAGKAAHTTHIGPYAGLPAAHVELNAWCERESLELAGIAWEVYGDCHDDVATLVTDVYFQLK